MSANPDDQLHISDHVQRTLGQISRHACNTVRRKQTALLNDTLGQNKVRILELDRQLLDVQRQSLDYWRRLDAHRSADERFRAECQRHQAAEMEHTRVPHNLLRSMSAVKGDEQVDGQLE